MRKISFMQGRLLPKQDGRFQSFPVNAWRDEFYTAETLGLYSVEWIYEHPHWQQNPVTTDDGIKQIKSLITETGVLVRSICADYYMTELLVKDGQCVQENWRHLQWLIQQGRKLGITYIVLPFVDSSSIKTAQDHYALIEGLKNVMKLAEQAKIELHLEADLNPADFEFIFNQVAHPMLKMNYDTGNSASLGYDPEKEFAHLSKYLGSVHIKDRVLGGNTVALGTGDTQFEKCFRCFEEAKFDRWYVLQAARGPQGMEAETLVQQIEFVKNLNKVVVASGT